MPAEWALCRHSWRLGFHHPQLSPLSSDFDTEANLYLILNVLKNDLICDKKMPQIKAFIVSIEFKYNLALVSTSEFKGLNC